MLTTSGGPCNASIARRSRIANSPGPSEIIPSTNLFELSFQNTRENGVWRRHVLIFNRPAAEFVCEWCDDDAGLYIRTTDTRAPQIRRTCNRRDFNYVLKNDVNGFIWRRHADVPHHNNKASDCRNTGWQQRTAASGFEKCIFCSRPRLLFTMDNILYEHFATLRYS